MIQKYRVTTIYSTSFFNLLRLTRDFNEKNFSSLVNFLYLVKFNNRNSSLLQEEFPSAKHHNLYGPTETNVVTSFELTEFEIDKHKPIPIGYEKNDAICLILDENLNEVKDGEQGQLSFSGPFVADGYLNLIEKTSESFVKLNYKTEEKIFYMTGDLGYRFSGVLYIEGRIDHQSSYRCRIELREIEHHLKTLGDIENATVLALRDKDGTCTGLLAFVQTKANLNFEAVKSELGKHIPHT